MHERHNSSNQPIMRACHPALLSEWMVVTAIVGIWLILGSQPFVFAGDEAAEETKKLEKVLNGLQKADDSVKWLSRAALVAALRKPSSEITGAVEMLSKLDEVVVNTKLGVDKVLKLKELREASAEAKKVAKKSKGLSDDGWGYIPKLESLRKAINEVDVGLVSQASGDRFKVSLDLLLKEPGNATGRLSSLAEAMKANIEQLEKREILLGEIWLRSRAASKVLMQLSDGLVKANTVGGGAIFGNTLLLNALDADKLAAKCNEVASDAESKRSQIARARVDEKRRYENLRTNLKTFWGIGK